MNKAIVSFGFDRPEIMTESFKSIMACPEYKNYEWHCYLDGQGRAQRNFYQEDFPHIRFGIRDQRIGLNANILLAFKELFEFYKYDYILYVEDDIIVSPDFIRFCEYCLMHYKTEGIFTVGAFSRVGEADYYTASHVKRFNWYHPWGAAIDKEDYNTFAEHIDAYVAQPIIYMNDVIGPELKEKCPEHYEREFKEGKCINITQDCLLNAARAISGKHQLIPIWSRSQNIGFYGVHQPGEYNGEDLNDPNVHALSMHATHRFRPPYQWDKLIMVDGVEQ